MRGALRTRSAPQGLAAVLGETIRDIADDGTERGTRVGKGLIVQALSRQAVIAGNAIIVSPLTPAVNSAIYVAPDGTADRWESPWIACGGGVLVGGGGPAGGPGSMSEQIEAQVRSAPIVMPPGESTMRVRCPFCARAGEATDVDAELAEAETERRIHCKGDRGDPLIVVRG
jgi:hypothetical protein